MKTLLLVRHAKSSWDSAAITDFDRPLNERGKSEAPMMAKRLKELEIDIDVFISSPAKRAKKTAKLFARELDKKENHIIYVTNLYNASAKDFYEVIQGIDDKYKTVAIFSHNPGITEFANILTSKMVDNMPTSSVYVVKAFTKKWIEFKDTEKEFWFFDYPKKV
ncbi:MAG: histidine phosphatase family protein [Ginsengibacter sp.]